MTYKDGAWGAKAKARAEKRKNYFKDYRRENAMRRYGITQQEYDQMHKKQKGKCAICKKAESAKSYNSKNGPQRLSIDHCHTTGKVRGLLCFSCNRGIGYLKDSTKNLKTAIEYLEASIQ